MTSRTNLTQLSSKLFLGKIETCFRWVSPVRDKGTTSYAKVMVNREWFEKNIYINIK